MRCILSCKSDMSIVLMVLWVQVLQHRHYDAVTCAYICECKINCLALASLYHASFSDSAACSVQHAVCSMQFAACNDMSARLMCDISVYVLQQKVAKIQENHECSLLCKLVLTSFPCRGLQYLIQHSLPSLLCSLLLFLLQSCKTCQQ